MEGTAEYDHVLPTGCDTGDLNRIFHCLRTRISEEERINGGGRNGAKFFDESQHGFMDHEISLRMKEESGLFANRFDHFWMAVTSIRYANPTGEVEKFAPILRVDVRSLGSFSYEV